MIRRIIAFFICLIGIALPCRIRILYAEFLGWLTQGIYFFYFSIIKFIISHIKVGRS